MSRDVLHSRSAAGRRPVFSLRRVLILLGPDLSALIAFTALWIGIMLAYGAKLHLVDGSILLPGYFAVFFIALAAVGHVRSRYIRHDKGAESFPRRCRRILRDWLPVVALLMVYETLRDYTGLIRPDYIDAALYRMDVALFGIEPTVFAQRFIHPFWTDYFSVMYGLYLVPSMSIGALLYSRDRRWDFKEVAMGCVLCMYSGFLCYLMFPAGPPRFSDLIEFDPPQLHGMFGVFELLDSSMNRSSHIIHRASFPSLHAALTFLALLQAFRFGDVWKKGPLVAIFAWVSGSIWLSTIYLRHHWAVDLLAGFVLAVCSFVAAKAALRWWRRLDVPNAGR